MPLQIDLGLRGMWTDPGPLSDAPPGALNDARNVIFRRPGIAEPRRGLSGSTSLSTAGDRTLRRLIPYAGELFVAAVGGSDERLVIASSNTEVLYGGASIQLTSPEIHYAEMRQSLYVTTDHGVLRLDSATDAVAALAGTPIGLMGTVTSISTGNLNLPTGNQWAIRMLFSKRFANGYDSYGAPSGRIILQNTTGLSISYSLTVPLPTEIVAGDTIQIYRSRGSGGGTILPNDELFLAVEYVVTSADVTAGQVAIEDHVNDDDLGASLYTNDGQETILQSNYRPPRARDVATYQGMMFFADVTDWHRLDLTLLNVRDSTDVGLDDFTFVGDVILGAPDILNVTSPQTSWIGRYVQNVTASSPAIASATFPAETKIIAVSGTTVTVDKNALETNTTETFRAFAWVAFNGRNYYFGDTTDTANRKVGVTSTGDFAGYSTAYSLARVINFDDDSTLWANIATFTESRAVISLEARTLGIGAVAITGHPAIAFSPSLSGLKSTVTRNDARVNRLRWSKIDQPESVPVVNFVDVGAERYRILRIAKARDSLLIFKADGVWRLTGSSPDALRVDLFDPTLRLLNPNALCEYRGTVIAWTNRGVVQISDAGVVELSAPAIAVELRSIESAMAADDDAHGFWMAAHETDQYVLVGWPKATTDGYATKAWCYSFLTSSWSYWDFTDQSPWRFACGVVDPVSNLLRLGGISGTSALLRNEQNLATEISGADVQTSITITVVSGTSITIAGGSGWTPAVGDAIYQGGVVGVIDTVASSTQFTVVTAGVFTAAAATALEAITYTLEWTVRDGGQTAVAKHWLRLVLHAESFGQVRLCSVGTKNNAQSTLFTDVGHLAGVGAGLTPREIEVLPPRATARGSRLMVRAQIAEGAPKFQIGGLSVEFEPMSTRVHQPSQ